MRLSRQSRTATAILALISLLFTHVALAMYQCPGEQALGAPVLDSPRADPVPMMPGCDGMDLEQPALCQAHAQVGNQSLDKPHPPDVAPFSIATLLFVLDPATEAGPISLRPAVSLLARNTAPPLAVRNCCFRI